MTRSFMTFHDSYIIKKNVYKKLYIQNKIIEMSVTNVFSTKSLYVQLLSLVPFRDRRASDVAHLMAF